MKKLILTFFIFISCSSIDDKKNIPTFDGNNAYQYIVEQCNFGPRNPGSKGHEQFAIFLEVYDYLLALKFFLLNYFRLDFLKLQQMGMFRVNLLY